MNYTLLALVVSAFSLLVSFIAFKRNDKYKRIEKTPVLLPTLSQKGEQVLVQFESKENHAFNINITFSGGKIPTQMTFTESFVGGDFKSRKFPIKKDILDGCSIDVNYKNIFGNYLEISGTIHVLEDGIFDIQK